MASIDRKQATGWLILLLLALLFLWAVITGALADFIASVFAPTFLEQ